MLLLLPRWSLEAAVQSDQEGMIGGRLKDMFLRLNPVDVLQHNT